MTKSLLFKTHRWLSIICLIPVLFWSLSGILHPVMANWFRIETANSFLIEEPIKVDSSMMTFIEVAKQNSIDTFQNIRIVRMEERQYYQIQENYRWRYFSCKTGNELSDGDRIYAKQLARFFAGDHYSKITSIVPVHSYTNQYKEINRLLPVYKVSFSRNDGLEAYVHTESSRLGTLNDNARKVYLWSFSMFHNWDFLGQTSGLKTTVVFIFSSMVFITGSLGLYLFIANRKKYKARTMVTDKLKPRNRHRKIAVGASTFLLLFSFSGAFHVIKKFEKMELHTLRPEATFFIDSLIKDPTVLISGTADSVNQISMVKVGEIEYYRLNLSGFECRPKYVDTKTGLELINGDNIYAEERARAILKTKNKVAEISLVTEFMEDYAFINKRLPVVKISFENSNGMICFIETSSGIPGVILNERDKYETLSFHLFHKYHMLDFLGKGWRDFVLSLAAISVSIIGLSGLIVFLKIKRKG